MADRPDQPDAADGAEAHEEWEARFSELHDGTLGADEAAAVRAHLAGCAACRAAFAEFEDTMAALGGLKVPRGTQPAPEKFAEHVEDTIARRSAGRFFGRKTLGDRVPFGWLLVVALIVLIAVSAVLWSSSTGSLRYHRDRGTTPPSQRSHEVVPHP